MVLGITPNPFVSKTNMLHNNSLDQTRYFPMRRLQRLKALWRRSASAWLHTVSVPARLLTLLDVKPSSKRIHRVSSGRQVTFPSLQCSCTGTKQLQRSGREADGMKPRRKLVKQLTLRILFGALVVMTTLEKATAFGSNHVSPNPRPSARANNPGSVSDAQEWLAKLTSQWFKLPIPLWSAPTAAKVSRSASLAPDDVRVTIQELRNSNAKLRAEVLALRLHMQRRGFMLEAEESKDDPSARLTLSSPWPQSSGPTEGTSPQMTSKPPPKLPREAQLAALALLWAAAISAGGVFVPVAIGEGAARTLRWLDDDGTLVPERLRRPSVWEGGGVGDGGGYIGGGGAIQALCQFVRAA